MGPDALRVAGLHDALSDLGHVVSDHGDIRPGIIPPIEGPPHLVALSEVIAWTRTLAEHARKAISFPVFMGGDHAIALGTASGLAARAASAGKPLFVLWLDAHTDFHTPHTTKSGNLHGTPMAYVTGQPGFEAFPPLAAPVPLNRVCMMGLRSVDPAERAALAGSEASLHDMRSIDETGIAPPLRGFLAKVAQAGGHLHVSLDVDFLDPSIAPAVGTTVPGGATFREAHLVMEMLCEAGLVTSLDIVELNPALDERGRTAALMVDLTASLMGRRIFDRPTHSLGAT